MNLSRFIEHFGQDLRLGLRVLIKQPGAMLASIGALSLGIGLVAFMFCMIKAMLFQMLPFPDASQLIYTSVPSQLLREYREQQTTFEGLAAYTSGTQSVRADGVESRRQVCYVTANFFDVLRVKPRLGRNFLSTEDAIGAPPAVILTHQFWRDAFQTNQAILGATIQVNGQAATVIGILPEDYGFADHGELWVASPEAASRAYDGRGMVRSRGMVFGRLKPATSLSRARRELNAIAARLAGPSQAREAARNPIRAGLFIDGPLDDPQPKIIALAILLLTFFVLCLACANVTTLILARAVKRGTELAVRCALGATRARLVSQMMMESLILAVGGALGGLCLAQGAAKWFAFEFFATHPELDPAVLWSRFKIFDRPALLFVVCLTFTTNLLIGLLPALQATRRDVNELLKDHGLASARRGLAGWQRALVTSQVAMSVSILIATLVVVSYSRQINHLKLPFDPTAFRSAQLSLPPRADPTATFEELERNLARIPGVTGVTFASGVPSKTGWEPIEIEGQLSTPGGEPPRVGRQSVSPSYFATLNQPLTQGRAFGPEDRAGTLPVAIVNASFVKRFFPTTTPIGRRFRNLDGGPLLTIIGEAPDLVFDPADVGEGYYTPMSQQPSPVMSVTLHAVGNQVDWAKLTRAELARLQPEANMWSMRTIQENIERDHVGYSLAEGILAVCGFGSLFLATLGIVGLITFSVNQRTREIGIRIALGATRQRIIAAILRQSIWQITAGLVIGAGIAFGLVQTVAHLVPLPTHQPWVYAVVLSFLGGLSLMAVLWPASRASKVDPMVALRYE